jgi:hypothetical protein
LRSSLASDVRKKQARSSLADSVRKNLLQPSLAGSTRKKSCSCAREWATDGGETSRWWRGWLQRIHVVEGSAIADLGGVIEAVVVEGTSHPA